jgi:cellulose biosynthesis protein BcsQ
MRDGDRMGDLSGFLEKLYELLKYDEIRKSLFVVLPIAALLGFWIGRYFPVLRKLTPLTGTLPAKTSPDPRIEELEVVAEELRAKLAIGPEAVRRLREAVAETGPGLWLAVPPKFPSNYHLVKSGIPILTVANLKGGVGKTTIATGLAAHFANPFAVPTRNRERVLLIDLDFQGSLSSMALTRDQRIPSRGQLSRATLLLSGNRDGADLIQMHQRVKGLDALQNGGSVQFYAIPAYYDLAQAENRLMVEWLLSDGSKDMRYNLADLLFSDVVQRSYDRIIIDAPPRTTTAHVQALAASSHVLIPTVLDQLSGEAVGSFVNQLILHHELWPNLKIIGVVGSMTEQDQNLPLRNFEKGGGVAIKAALDQVADFHALRGPATEVMSRASFIPQLTDLGRAAGTRIGYLDNSQGVEAAKMRRVFDNLGQAVLDGLPRARELKDLVRS